MTARTTLRGATGRGTAVSTAPPVRLSPLPQRGGTDYHLRHDLPLQNYDVMVCFTNEYRAATGTAFQVLKVQARNPLGAIRLAGYTPDREWPPEMLLAINRVDIKKTS